ncbi:hypothetical protein AMTRI_Chr10g229360 [Amborella trichopoda]
MSANMVVLYSELFDHERLKNKHKLIRKMYSELKKQISSTGFGWELLRGMVMTENELCDQYIKFRRKSAHDVNELDKIFCNTVDEGTDGSAPPLEVDDSPIESPHLDTSDENIDIFTPSNALSQKERQGTPTEQVVQSLTKLVETMTEMMSLQTPVQSEIKMKKCMDDVDELYKKGEVGLEVILKATCIFQNASKVSLAA